MEKPNDNRDPPFFESPLHSLRNYKIDLGIEDLKAPQITDGDDGISNTSDNNLIISRETKRLPRKRSAGRQHRPRDDAGWSSKDSDTVILVNDSRGTNIDGNSDVGWIKKWGTETFSQDDVAPVRGMSCPAKPLRVKTTFKRATTFNNLEKPKNQKRLERNRLQKSIDESSTDKFQHSRLDSKFELQSRRRILQHKEKQRKQMARLLIPGWREVAAGDKDSFINNEEFDVDIVGPFGETVLHWALLQGQEEMALYLMQEYPELIHFEYTEEPFVGEGTMHIAVANNMTDAVREMLEICHDYAEYKRETDMQGAVATEELASMNDVSGAFNHKWDYPLNEQIVKGIFFQRDHQEGKIYYGQHNLAFAVCRGNQEMVELMVEHNARLDVIDNHRNSIIHLCVLFNNAEMFNKLVQLGSEAEENGNKFRYCGPYYDEDDEPTETDCWKTWIQRHRNEDRYTALQAAVAWNKIEMFQHLLKYQRKDGWRWGPLAMFEYPLIEIDTHGLENPHSVLEVIVSEGRRKFLDIPVIKDIFREKWEQYGKYVFKVELFVYTIWIFCLTLGAHCIDFRCLDSKGGELNLDRGTTFLVVMSALLSVIFLLIEVAELKDLFEEHGRKGGLKIYCAIQSAKSKMDEKSGIPERRGTIMSISGIFKMIVWLRNTITLCAALSLSIKTRPALHFALVFYLFAIILAFLGLLEYFQLEKHAGRFVIMVLKILIRDVSVFLLVWMVILWGFAFSFTLIRKDKDFNHSFFFSLETSLSFGEFANESEAFYDTQLYDVMGRFIYVLFVMFSVVLLLNLLIAVMAETTQAIGESDINRLNFEEQWASTVLKMERRVPACFYKRTGSSKVGVSDPPQSCCSKLFKNDSKTRDANVVYHVTSVKNLEIYDRKGHKGETQKSAIDKEHCQHSRLSNQVSGVIRK